MRRFTLLQACVSMLPTGSKFKSSAIAYKRVLLESSLRSVGLALTLGTQGGRRATRPANVSMSVRDFIQKVFIDVGETYRNGLMSNVQQGEFGKLLGQQSEEYRQAIADILDEKPRDIPVDSDAIQKYLDDKRVNLDGPQVRRF